MKLARIDTHDAYKRKRELSNRFGWAVFLTISLLIGLAITTLVVDGEGRKGYHHTTPLPPKVMQIDSSRYVVLDNATDASKICTGPVTSGNPRIRTVRELKVNDRDLKATYVSCGHKQYWNDHRAVSLNLPSAAQKVFINPFTIVGGGLFLLVLWSFPLRYQIAVDRWEASERRKTEQIVHGEQIKEGRLRELHAAEQQVRFDKLKSELVGEWSKPDTNLSDLDFENKLADLEAKRERGEL